MRTARFAELTGTEVYGLCRLRVDVFVVEQQCPYPELDGRDVEPATVHLWFADEDGGIAATIRVLDDGDTEHVAEARAGTGAWIAALSPALTAPLTGWLRAAAAGGAVDPAAEAFARALLARLP